MLAWGAFSSFGKSLLVIMPPQRTMASDFVDIVYQRILGGFYFLHNHPQDLTLMEDGTL